ncbi:MAG: TonB-dependent receptor [Labilithrix sp.]|nr:TonB-dependent receptor [Labilithrix sp.]
MATDGSRRVVAASLALFLVAASRPARADEPEAAPGTPAPAPAPPADDAVVVRGNKADNLERATGSGTQIGKQEIQHAQPQGSQEIFRRVPGVNVRSEDGMGLRLNIGVRGLNPARGRLVLMQEDGVPVVVSPYGEPELYYSTPIERIERLDVRKGPEVLLDGPQTVGGVVNLYTWAPPTHQEWSVEADYGSRSYAKGLARYGDAIGDVRYLVQVFRKQGDGFRNMPFDATDLMAKIAFPTGRGGEATLKATAYDETSHTTYVGLTQPMYQQDPRQDNPAPDDVFGIRRYELSLHHEQHLGDDSVLRTTLFAYAVDLQIDQQDFDRERLGGVEYARVLGPEGVTGSALYFRRTRTLRDRRYEVAGVEPQLETRFTTGPALHRLIVGGRMMADVATRRQARGDSPTAEVGDLTSDDTTSILGLAAYAQDRIAFRDDLLVTPAIRVEHSNSHRKTRRVLADGVSTDEDLSGSSQATGVMPGIAFAAGRPALNLFWGVHSGYSSPRVAQAITPDGKDAGLSAERSMNYEVGARARPLRWLRAEATGFVTAFDNQLISNNTLSGSSAEFKNGGKTRHVGAELTAIAHAGARQRLPVDVDLQLQYTYVKSTFSDGPNEGNFVPYSPEHTLTATLDGEHASGFGAQVSWSYVGVQWADETNSVEPDISGRVGKIPGYNVLDLGARYRHRPTGLSFHLSMKNALDDTYLSSRVPNGIFTAGFRQFIAGIKWQGG